MMLVAKKSGSNGRGCFAAADLPARRKVGELRGERISNREAARRVARGGKVRICQLDDRWSIDASVGGDATALINHSCDPNCFSRTTRGHMLFFARRAIAAGEELTLELHAVAASRPPLHVWGIELPQRNALRKELMKKTLLWIWSVSILIATMVAATPAPEEEELEVEVELEGVVVESAFELHDLQLFESKAMTEFLERRQLRDDAQRSAELQKTHQSVVTTVLDLTRYVPIPLFNPGRPIDTYFLENHMRPEFNPPRTDPLGLGSVSARRRD